MTCHPLFVSEAKAASREDPVTGIAWSRDWEEMARRHGKARSK